MELELISQARRGDALAFERLTAPHRRELRVHCYRMLGSCHDAEDLLQETLLAAWQSFGQFEGRASLRSWLYKIATNRCLNARRAIRRRPAKAYDVPDVAPPPPTRLGEVPWLEPFPDALLEGGDERGSPETRYEQSQSIALTFIAALQRLPPRQLAVLVLCDVLGFEAAETAELLEASIDAVNSALKRARANLRTRPLVSGAGSAEEQLLTAKFARAWESADVDAVVALLTDDVFISMPPIPNEYEGIELAARFCASIFDAGRRFVLRPTRANRQPAFGAYLRSPSGVARAVGLYVLTLRDDRISAMTRFEPTVFDRFDLPASLPSR